MRSILAIVVGLAIGPALAAPAPDRPDPATTPGAVDPSVTQDNIDVTICVRGYTKIVRPPARYTNRLKREQLATVGYLGLQYGARSS